MAIETVKQDVREECDTLTKKLAQLHALLSMTYGDAQEGFDGMSDELKDHFMWACHDMADDCLTLSHTVSTAVYRHTPNTATSA